MRFIYNLLALSCLIEAALSVAVVLPRDNKGGGGGRGGGGGGSRGSGGSGSRTVGTAYTSGAGRGGSGDTGRPAISVPAASNGRSANYFSQGGGKRFTLPASSFFKGREMGGGKRSEVGGTRGYGSGYPYSQGDIRRTGVAGQPFPFGFWPVYWGGYGHSREYGRNRTVTNHTLATRDEEEVRPGGDQVIAQLVPSSTIISLWGSVGSTNQSLWLIGDAESVGTMLSLLYDSQSTYTYGCGINSVNTQPFAEPGTGSPVRFENVIQWYRASSFALAYETYNNSYALSPLNETTCTEWAESDPLPVPVQYSALVQCINKTILAALPILDEDPAPATLSGGAIAGITVASILAVLGILIVLLFVTPQGKKLFATPKVKRILAKIANHKKEKENEYTPTAVDESAAQPKDTSVGAEKDTAAPQFPLPIHYDAVITEKISRVPSPAPPEAPPSPHANNNLSVSHTRRESAYSAQTLVEDAVRGHDRKSGSLHLK